MPFNILISSEHENPDFSAEKRSLLTSYVSNNQNFSGPNTFIKLPEVGSDPCIHGVPPFFDYSSVVFNGGIYINIFMSIFDLLTYFTRASEKTGYGIANFAGCLLQDMILKQLEKVVVQAYKNGHIQKRGSLEFAGFTLFVIEPAANSYGLKTGKTFEILGMEATNYAALVNALLIFPNSYASLLLRALMLIFQYGRQYIEEQLKEMVPDITITLASRPSLSACSVNPTYFDQLLYYKNKIDMSAGDAVCPDILRIKGAKSPYFMQPQLPEDLPDCKEWKQFLRYINKEFLTPKLFNTNLDLQMIHPAGMQAWERPNLTAASKDNRESMQTQIQTLLAKGLLTQAQLLVIQIIQEALIQVILYKRNNMYVSSDSLPPETKDLKVLIPVLDYLAEKARCVVSGQILPAKEVIFLPETFATDSKNEWVAYAQTAIIAINWKSTLIRDGSVLCSPEFLQTLKDDEARNQQALFLLAQLHKKVPCLSDYWIRHRIAIKKEPQEFRLKQKGELEPSSHTLMVTEGTLHAYLLKLIEAITAIIPKKISIDHKSGAATFYGAGTELKELCVYLSITDEKQPQHITDHLILRLDQVSNTFYLFSPENSDSDTPDQRISFIGPIIPLHPEEAIKAELAEIEEIVRKHIIHCCLSLDNSKTFSPQQPPQTMAAPPHPVFVPAASAAPSAVTSSAFFSQSTPQKKKIFYVTTQGERKKLDTWKQKNQLITSELQQLKSWAEARREQLKLPSELVLPEPTGSIRADLIYRIFLENYRTYYGRFPSGIKTVLNLKVEINKIAGEQGQICILQLTFKATKGMMPNDETLKYIIDNISDTMTNPSKNYQLPLKEPGLQLSHEPVLEPDFFGRTL